MYRLLLLSVVSIGFLLIRLDEQVELDDEDEEPGRFGCRRLSSLEERAWRKVDILLTVACLIILVDRLDAGVGVRMTVDPPYMDATLEPRGGTSGGGGEELPSSSAADDVAAPVLVAGDATGDPIGSVR